jgi:hypothetical protein
MSKMSWISYLCENNMRDELIEEVQSIEVADNFLEAHKRMRDNRDSPAYKTLNEIHDKFQKEFHDAKVSSVRVSSKK